MDPTPPDRAHLAELRRHGVAALTAWLDRSRTGDLARELTLGDDEDAATTAAGLLLVADLLLMQLAVVTETPPDELLQEIAARE